MTEFEKDIIDLARKIEGSYTTGNIREVNGYLSAMMYAVKKLNEKAPTKGNK